MYQLFFYVSIGGDKTAIKIGVKENNTNIWVNYIKSGNEKTADLDDLKLHKLNRGWHEIPVVLSHYDKKTTARGTGLMGAIK